MPNDFGKLNESNVNVLLKIEIYKFLSKKQF
jgi:hypothetical protein